MSDHVQANITAFWNTVATDYEMHPGNVVPPGSEAYERWVECSGG